MRKLLLSLFTVVAALSMANAGEVTLLTNSGASTWEGDSDGYSTVIDGFTISYTKGGSPAIAPSADHIRVYKGATFTVKNNSGEAITGIVINCTAKSYCANIMVGEETVVADKDNNTITWSGNLSEFIAKSNEAQIRVKSIVITYGQPAAVAIPKFSPVEGTYYAAQEVTLSCATADATIHYTTDNSDPTTSSATYSDPIKIETTTTIKAIAVKGGDKSDIASATYTIAEPATVENIAAFNELSKETVVKFVNPVNVIYQNDVYLFVQDATGALQIYGTIGQTYKNGNVIPAGFMGTVDVYSGLIQMKPMMETFEPAADGAVIEPVVVTSQEVSDNMVNKLVKIMNATLTLDDGKSKNYTLTDDKGQIAVYDRFKGVTVPDLEKKYDITAIVNIFNGAIQLFPIEYKESEGGVGFADVESASSIVAAGDKAINIDAAENAQVLVVNAVGQVVANKAITAGANTIDVPAGFYVVRVNNAVTKVIIK
ncbi:chitobiase/beta-hexosaminidase C-terminal domain-containing protein [Bacteroides salyersiae]|jgi:glycoside hydrolase family 18|uniref:chitobiase/beta-hexosaminidase C-terminal domain-containing protein n=1 Tax=Bacteroides salyersiae TaxID=291644 RepID=UPI00032704D1|nr:chitobiase/beta-hexosaminidase C-terminal domain-containing protein [Bacteroides salyersiae]EOA49669.1 por secretion system C-terminal sorting domain-containing protein [Bacteroides salyersiae WAL 10018 = DSM 18765 = JCM 12988]MBV4205151.1 chitobiase/beta-hexosaminidase C-terminal domain-containing protein [Bacteroides salyersiae]MCB6649879.1 chitobiase/beta-hexosaminidase C-terminal domain-containing protein [Bacteroides salyersiae]MCS3057997.1 chitobiase/beta-hexosaminidase C-terminal doma